MAEAGYIVYKGCLFLCVYALFEERERKTFVERQMWFINTHSHGWSCTEDIVWSNVTKISLPRSLNCGWEHTMLFCHCVHLEVNRHGHLMVKGPDHTQKLLTLMCGVSQSEHWRTVPLKCPWVFSDLSHLGDTLFYQHHDMKANRLSQSVCHSHTTPPPHTSWHTHTTKHNHTFSIMFHSVPTLSLFLKLT